MPSFQFPAPTAPTGGSRSARGEQSFTDASAGPGVILLSDALTNPTHIVVEGIATIGPIVIPMELLPLNIVVRGNMGNLITIQITSFAPGFVNYTVQANTLAMGETAIIRLGAYQDS
jgi:hypothetical protein